VLHGQIVGIAQNATTAAGQDLTLQLTGVVEIPKAAGSFGLGVLLYFDSAAGRATTTATANRPLGFHAGQTANAGAAGTLCFVLLTPSVVVTP
jgi:predicted RecA/RadA family phage recombinase